MSSETSDDETFSEDLHNLQELELACRKEDVVRIRELFRTTLLNRGDATNFLRNALPDRFELMRCLLEHGADPNLAFWSEDLRNLDALKLLTEFGFDIQSQGHLFLQHFVRSREALDWLLDQGVDPNLTDAGRTDTGLYLGGQHDYSVKVLSNIAKLGDIELFDHIVSRGADPLRSMALHRVSHCEDDRKTTAMIDHLLDHHNMDIEADLADLADPDHFFTSNDNDTGTPLCYAVRCENLAAFRRLLQRGAKPDEAMAIAIGSECCGGWIPAYLPLLDAGANPDRALELAVGANNVGAAFICLREGANLECALEEQRRLTEERAMEEPHLLQEDEGDYEEGIIWKRRVMASFLRSNDRGRRRIRNSSGR